MIKASLLIIGLLFAGSLFAQRGPVKVKNSTITGVCFAGANTHRIYISPPDEFLKKDGSKTGGTITVYYTDFTSEAKAAMEYAIDILEQMLPADTRLTVLARWQNISTAGVLGNSSVTGFYAGWAINALDPLAYYPAGLAEKIAGKSLNEDQLGDFVLNINSSINWYLGTDGNTYAQQYDLVTVIIHEICHGLGFFDSMNTESAKGYYGFDSIPVVYDKFVENAEGKRLTDTLQFENNSTELYAEMTGDQLYFNGPLSVNYGQLQNYTPDFRAKLYAPSSWESGSSVSHLDEQPNTLQENSLMTPFIQKEEAIHDPGKLTFSILGDLGWINTRFIHDPVRSTEVNLSEVLISAIIKSDTLYNRDSVGVVYSFDNFITIDTIFMTSPNSDDSFNTLLSIPAYNTNLEYYLFVKDHFSRLYRSPSLYGSIRYEAYFGLDTIKPVITHTPVSYYLETVDSIKFKATATDNLGIDSVYIEYRLNDGGPEFIGLVSSDYDSYTSVINARLLQLNGGDSLRYRVFASDTAINPNISVLPENGFFVVKIEDIGITIDRYSTDFTNADGDFLNFDFSITKPSGFTNYGLHTRHPYESSEDNDKNIEYTAMFRNPIKFNGSGMLISFKELVLVEPGETGALFGSDDFYDYVVLEVSKNFGKSWINLMDGYDSRYAASWEKAYNSAIINIDSKYVGKESMLVERSMFYTPNDKIQAGDTLLFRFRLFSDPFANGWGWVIEDLNINNLVDAVEKISKEPVKVYPNPGRGLINIRSDMQNYGASKPVPYKVFNSAGICIIDSFIYDESETVVDISAYPSGLYIIILYRDDGIRRIKYSLIK